MGYCFDIETLDTESTAVILSAAIVYFDANEDYSYNDLLKSTLFVKFDAKDQIERLGRTISKDTLEWWNKQPQETKDWSLNPSKYDVTVEDGLQKIYSYIRTHPRNQTFWQRGGLDQVVLDSLIDKVNYSRLTQFNKWRDIRTALDIFYDAPSGYVPVSHNGFSESLVIKHNPIHDVCYDVMMLLYGEHRNA